MNPLMLTIACTILLFADVHADMIRILDRNGNTSHPSIKCWLHKEFEGELGKTYIIVIPKDFISDMSLHVKDLKGDMVFMGSLEQHDNPVKTNDSDSRRTMFYIRLDHIQNSMISMSGKKNSELVSYSLSLALPENNKAEQAGTGQPATRPESKSSGGDKPQPEAEGRSR